MHKKTDRVDDIFIWHVVVFNVRWILWICYKTDNVGEIEPTLQLCYFMAEGY